MKISRFSVQRPVLTSMVMMIVLILGGVSLNRLPIDLMPKITYPTLTVRSDYPNAGPEKIEDLLTRPIEEAVSAVPGVEEVISTSMDGSAVVRVSFGWEIDLDEAANDIRDRLERILDQLPEEASRPTLFKFDLAQYPILILGVVSELDPIEVRRIVEEQVKYRIERVPGVAAIDVWGGMEPEIQVRVAADKIKALQLSFKEIIAAIKAQNTSIPTGTLKKGNYDLVINTSGEYESLEELRNTVVSIREGVAIQVKDIAEVAQSHKKTYHIIKINGVPGIRLGVRKQSLANTVDVAQAVLTELERINQDFPHLNMIPLVDTSDYIQRSITNVGRVAAYGGIFAVLVLLFFLGSFRSTAIISTAIPISIIATFMLVYFAGFTINLMSLGGFAIGVGMIVDNSIVVLENIFRMRREGVPSIKAAILGSEQVTSAIIASTLTTLVIFLPLLFIRDMAGIMFRQLAFVISFALLASMGVALMLIPMLASKLMVRPVVGSKEKPVPTRGVLFHRFSTAFFRGLENTYLALLTTCLRNRIKTVIFVMVLLGLSLGLVPFIGVEYMPAADESEVRVYATMDVGTHLDVLSERFKAIEDTVRESVPEVKNMITRLGASHWSGGGSHSGQIQVSLKPLEERARSSDAVAEDLRRKLTHIPGMEIRTRSGQGLFIFRLAFSSEDDRIQIDIRGYDIKTASELAQRVKELVEKVKGVTDVRLSLESGRPEERIIVDRERAADMRLTVTDIAGTLQTILSGTLSGQFRDAGQEVDIMVKVKDADQMNINDLLDLTVVNAIGEPIVLKNVVSVQQQNAPVQIQRKDQERVVTLSVNTIGRDMGSVLSDIRASVSNIALPRDFSIVYTGDYEAQQEAFQELLVSILLAIVLVYMVLASLYESLRDPLVVLFSVPLAIVGVTLMLFLTDTTFNVQSYIGCIMLAGIVVNNAILLVDQINLIRSKADIAVNRAILIAGKRRLRPILMTASTTILGMLPMSLGLFEGGETQAALARAVIGGLASSTLITLVFVPVLYSLAEKWFPRRMYKR